MTQEEPTKIEPEGVREIILEGQLLWEKERVLGSLRQKIRRKQS